MSKVVVMDHPLIQHKIGIMRRTDTGSKDFRTLVSEVAMLECYEATRDLKLVEHLGTGVRKILKKYNKDVYHFFPHFIRVSIKYNQNQFEYDSGNKYHIDFKGLSKIQEGIIDLLLDDSTLTQLELARILGVGERTIRYNMK